MPNLNRRQLLIAAALPAAARRASKMRFGFTTYQWGADWDLPTLIANCAKAKALGVELRTSAKYAHGVELATSDSQRREVARRFRDSPVALVGIASAERFDWPAPEKLKAAIESAKAHVKLSHDVGSRGVRVFPNDFHKDVPQEQTISQIARALNEVGRYAADHGQMIRLENHGSAGRLETLRKILDLVEAKSVRVKLNCDARDADGFSAKFALVKDRLADTLHMHELPDDRFPYQLQTDLLIDAGWNGWWLLEASGKVPDRPAALIEQSRLWSQLVEKSLKR
jgi:hypothetical protein